MGGVGTKEVGQVAYRFLNVLPNGGFTNWLFWIDGDQHVRVMFNVHARLIPQHVMELYAAIRNVVVSGGLSLSTPEVVPLKAVPIHYAQPYGSADEDNSKGDSTYVAGSRSSSDIASEDEFVPETPSDGVGRFLLSPSLAIPRLSDGPSHYQTLNLDAMQADNLLNPGNGEDYNTDGGVEFQVGHRFRNREAVLMAGGTSVRWITYLSGTYHVSGHAQLNSGLICKVMLLMIKTDLSVSILVLQSVVHQSYHFKPSYRKVWMAKQKAIAKIYSNWEESYNRIPALLQALQECLPGTIHECIACLITNNKKMLNYQPQSPMLQLRAKYYSIY
ncbi:hypothetical protein Ahy_B08g093879 [Arachis hypogaea]|uniref:Uncharacterized protein n=1 Tax=Arachis hypogaea TaxID=3818 RepID=A0A444Y769_ARAHY|nr:hypothetical protein Ahy_B08g093879 [Arachis hypogaea]